MRASISSCTATEWDEFIATSSMETVFNRSRFMEVFGLDVRYILCGDGSRPIGGIAVTESGGDAVRMPFAMYTGIVLDDSLDPRRGKRISRHFQALQALAGHLFSSYGAVRIANHYGLVDVRPFDWLNYHERGRGHYAIHVRYTSQAPMAGMCDPSGWADGRRSDLRKSLGFPLVTERSQDLAELEDLHLRTFSRQAPGALRHSDKYLAKVCAMLMRDNSGFLYTTRLEGKAVAASFFATDSRRAYYLVGASDPDYRAMCAGTRNMHEACVMLREDSGCPVLDFVGVNSPQRGAFKLSFGGSLIPYFEFEKVPAHA